MQSFRTYIVLTIQAFCFVTFLIFAAFFIAPLVGRPNINAYSVVSGSMEPTLPVGSYVFLKKIPIENISKDMVIAFESPADSSSIIIHRVLDVKKEGATISLKTKGDNNEAADDWVLQVNKVKGSLFLQVPLLGYPAQLIKTSVGFLALVIIPGIILCFLQILTIRDGINEEVHKRIAAKGYLKKEQLLGIALIFGLMMSVYSQSARAQLVATASIHGISFTTTSQPTPTGSPVPTSTPTPTATPTASPGGLCPVQIIIEGNGAGSQNNVIVICRNSTVIFQTNSVLGMSDIDYGLFYESQNIPGAILGKINLDGEKTIKKELYMGSCSATGCVAHPQVKNIKLKLKFN